MFTVSILYQLLVISCLDEFITLHLYEQAGLSGSLVCLSVCDSKTVTYKTLILLTTSRPNRTHEIGNSLLRNDYDKSIDRYSIETYSYSFIARHFIVCVTIVIIQCLSTSVKICKTMTETDIPVFTLARPQHYSNNTLH